MCHPRIFAQYITGCDCFQIRCIDYIASWTNCASLNDTGWDCLQLLSLTEKIDQPIENMIWYRSRLAIFTSNVTWRIVSNALLKSIAMTITYELVMSIWVTVWSSDINAAVVEPVGRNVYWSASVDPMIGWWNTGYRKLRTTDFSIILDGTDVTEIGLKSAGDWAAAILGMGRMTAAFHCRGTMEVETDKLNSVASGWQKTGAPPALPSHRSFLPVRFSLPSLFLLPPRSGPEDRRKISQWVRGKAPAATLFLW